MTDDNRAPWTKELDERLGEALASGIEATCRRICAEMIAGTRIGYVDADGVQSGYRLVPPKAHAYPAPDSSLAGAASGETTSADDRSGARAGATSGETGGNSPDQETRDALCSAEFTIERLRITALRLRAVALAARQFAPVGDQVMHNRYQRYLIASLRDLDVHDSHHGVRVHLDEAKRLGLPVYDADCPDSGPAKDATRHRAPSNAETVMGEGAHLANDAQLGPLTGALPPASVDHQAWMIAQRWFADDENKQEKLVADLLALVKREREAAVQEERKNWTTMLERVRQR